MNNETDLIERITYSIECYESVIDDYPADIWFCTESVKDALIEAYDYFESKEEYKKIELRDFNQDKRVAVLYR